MEAKKLDQNLGIETRKSTNQFTITQVQQIWFKEKLDLDVFDAE